MAGYVKRLSIQRTADTSAYLANDVIGTATTSGGAVLTFDGVGAENQAIVITTVSLEIDDTGIISGETSYRLYLYSLTPPGALGDNAPWDLPAGDRTSFSGYVDLGTPVDLGTTLYVETTQVNKQINLSGTSLYGYLVTNGPYTPTSGRVYVVKIHTTPL